LFRRLKPPNNTLGNQDKCSNNKIFPKPKKV
jgi:hypothetical protein